ncbi:hypothetical protein Q5752_005411 [Cryptotrichosporon argae]
MPASIPYIPISHDDAARRRLESTLDADLTTLSLSASLTDASASFASLSTIEAPRAGGDGAGGGAVFSPSLAIDDFDTPRPGRAYAHAGLERLPPRAVSGRSDASHASHISLTGASPVSSAGHHVSAATLGAGVFRRAPAAPAGKAGQADEFDPDRSLGRLAGQLGKVVGARRPTSPFASPPQHLSPPRSPSPMPPSNLSFSLTRADPLPSPPTSRSSSASHSHTQTLAEPKTRVPTQPTQPAQPERRALGETNRTNVPVPHERTAKGFPSAPRRASAPARADASDITGITALMDTPAKGLSFGRIHKDARVEPETGANIVQTLAALNARLRALENENVVSRRRVRELEAEVERARAEVEHAKRDGGARLREAVGEKSALEDLVDSLRSNLARLTLELESHKALVEELRAAPRAAHVAGDSEVRDELAALRREVERLAGEVHRLGDVVSQGLKARRRGDDDENNEREPSRLRQGLHAVASRAPVSAAPTPARPSHVSRSPLSDSDSDVTSNTTHADPHLTPDKTYADSSRRRRRRGPNVEGPASPFPSIREQDETGFFSVLEPDQRGLPVVVNDRPAEGPQASAAPEERRKVASTRRDQADDEIPALPEPARADVPPQTVLVRVLRELEDEFTHYKSVYIELAEQYGLLDAAAARAKRHVLSEHLKEVIDALEKKADQIASLYDLLAFEDRQDDRAPARPVPARTVSEILRGVRAELGDEARARLRRDGLGRALV